MVYETKFPVYADSGNCLKDTRMNMDVGGTHIKCDKFIKSTVRSDSNITRNNDNNCKIVKPEVAKPEPVFKNRNEKQYLSSLVVGI